VRIRGVDVARSRMVCPRLAKSRTLSCNTLDISSQSRSTAHILHEIGSPALPFLSDLSLSTSTPDVIGTFALARTAAAVCRRRAGR
jgi:hypothetical protein